VITLQYVSTIVEQKRPKQVNPFFYNMFSFFLIFKMKIIFDRILYFGGHHPDVMAT